MGLLADEVHFDPMLFGVVSGSVCKCVGVEIGVEFPVHAVKKIEVELCRDSFIIIIGLFQGFWAFDEVDSAQEEVVFLQEL